jgi:hypothetical protein
VFSSVRLIGCPHYSAALLKRKAEIPTPFYKKKLDMQPFFRYDVEKRPTGGRRHLCVAAGKRRR